MIIDHVFIKAHAILDDLILDMIISRIIIFFIVIFLLLLYSIRSKNEACIYINIYIYIYVEHGGWIKKETARFSVEHSFCCLSMYTYIYIYIYIYQV
jgi:hypothetical protein